MDTPQLTRDESGLALVVEGGLMRADFTRMRSRLRKANLAHELLVRAARIRGTSEPLTAIDATAGLGEDALLLAAAGFQVTLFERDALIAEVLADGLSRARADAQLREIVSRMELVCQDSIEALGQLIDPVDVIYLDPMFPAKKKSAATKKKLQMIQRLEGHSDDEVALLAAAIGARPRKVVVKRPLKGPYLADRKPSHSLCGKVVRFDVYVP